MTEPKAFPRRVPVLLAFMTPFRLVTSPDTKQWEANIEQINQRTWNFEQLHGIAGGLDVGLEKPYHLAIGFDGALALPPIPEFRDHQKAIRFFNRCLGALLLGGIYCEAVNNDDLSTGSIIDWKYIRIQTAGPSQSASFHNQIRMKMSSPLDSISLLNPRIQSVEELSKAIKEGLDILESIPNLSSEYLLRGTTGIAKLDWGAALSNLWIVLEQLISFLWEKHVVGPVTTDSEKIEGQREQLSDTRSWTVSNRAELLFQKRVLSHATLRSLSNARKARNKLVHDGFYPQKENALSAFVAILEILETILGKRVSLMDLNLEDHSLIDLFKPRERGPINPSFWMPIPKLPGEEELEKHEAKRD